MPINLTLMIRKGTQYFAINCLSMAYSKWQTPIQFRIGHTLELLIRFLKKSTYRVLQYSYMCVAVCVFAPPQASPPRGTIPPPAHTLNGRILKQLQISLGSRDGQKTNLNNFIHAGSSYASSSNYLG